MGKVKNMLLDSFDHDFEKYSDDDLINEAFDTPKLVLLDNGDMINLVEELARRYQNLLMILSRMDNP